MISNLFTQIHSIGVENLADQKCFWIFGEKKVREMVKRENKRVKKRKRKGKKGENERREKTKKV